MFLAGSLATAVPAQAAEPPPSPVPTATEATDTPAGGGQVDTGPASPEEWTGRYSIVTNGAEQPWKTPTGPWDYKQRPYADPFTDVSLKGSGLPRDSTLTLGVSRVQGDIGAAVADLEVSTDGQGNFLSAPLRLDPGDYMLNLVNRGEGSHLPHGTVMLQVGHTLRYMAGVAFGPDAEEKFARETPQFTAERTALEARYRELLPGVRECGPHRDGWFHGIQWRDGEPLVEQVRPEYVPTGQETSGFTQWAHEELLLQRAKIQVAVAERHLKEDGCPVPQGDTAVQFDYPAAPGVGQPGEGASDPGRTRVQQAWSDLTSGAWFRQPDTALALGAGGLGVVLLLTGVARAARRR